LLGVPFGFTGHAADLFRDRSALRDKIKRAEYIICISHFHRDFFLIYGARPDQLKIAYCGIDVEQFNRDHTRGTEHARLNRLSKFTILSSGRLVEKKGFDYLIEACKLLDGKLDFKCILAGSGELEAELNQKINALGLIGKVIVTGKPLLQEEITEFMHKGDCYCLPCVWASDNDVDGLPQMLMEAMACGIPVISTRLVGIPDLVIDKQTGLLVEPNDAQAIAKAIENLYQNSQTREVLSARAREFIVENFNLKTCLDPLIEEFRQRVNN
jgi:glycosyltransferase involved in cell wall biosynthesis